MNNIVTAAQLRGAAAAVDQLAAAGVKVLGYYCNGRKPVLLIDRAPQFVRGVMRRREPDGAGGQCRVMAAPFHGTQVEWRVPAMRSLELAHG